MALLLSSLPKNLESWTCHAFSGLATISSDLFNRHLNPAFDFNRHGQHGTSKSPASRGTCALLHLKLARAPASVIPGFSFSCETTHTPAGSLANFIPRATWLQEFRLSPPRFCPPSSAR